MRLPFFATILMALWGVFGFMAATSSRGAPSQSPEPYRLGPADILEIKVGGESDLSGRYRVSEDGFIMFPLLGALKVESLSCEQVKTMIHKGLLDGYLINPQVVAYVAEYASKKVAILGDVPSAGIYVLDGDPSLMAVLSRAGLRTTDTPNAKVIITRAAVATGDKASLPIVVDLDRMLNPWSEEPQITLHHGDRVFVRTKDTGKVLVSGRVKSTGIVPLGKGLTVMDSINAAGGLAEFGTLKGVRVVREGTEDAQVLRLDLSGILEGDRSQNIELQDGDIVVVPRRWF